MLVGAFSGHCGNFAKVRLQLYLSGFVHGPVAAVAPLPAQLGTLHPGPHLLLLPRLHSVACL